MTIPKKRARPRRERPELFYQPPAEESWESISLRMRHKWWRVRPVYCGICGFVIFTFEELVPDHIVPGKAGGCKDHSEENLQPAHGICNQFKGSKRNYTREQCWRDLGLMERKAL